MLAMFHGHWQRSNSEQLACEQAKPQHKRSMPPARDGNEKEEGAPMPNHVYNFIEFSNEDDARRVWEECSCEVASPGSDSGSPNPVPPESLERRFDFNR